MNSAYTACSKNGSSTTHLHTNIPSQLQCRKEAVLSTTGRQDDTEASSIRLELGHFYPHFDMCDDTGDHATLTTITQLAVAILNTKIM